LLLTVRLLRQSWSFLLVDRRQERRPELLLHDWLRGFFLPDRGAPTALWPWTWLAIVRSAVVVVGIATTAVAYFDAPADVYVINSCSVTADADKKSRYLARKASRTNPDAVVVMTGCHSHRDLEYVRPIRKEIERHGHNLLGGLTNQPMQSAHPKRVQKISAMPTLQDPVALSSQHSPILLVPGRSDRNCWGFLNRCQPDADLGRICHSLLRRKTSWA
jgi:hypothetical protein